MAAKATRTYILVLLLALGVVTSSMSVGVSTVLAASGSGGAANGDPDRPNDSSKPSVAQSTPTSAIQPCQGALGGPGASAGVERAESGWTWAKWYVATLLGRFGR